MRGTNAKENIIKKLEASFGEDFVGVFDKKVYLWADDGGEKVQIALAMTCPKTNVSPVKTYRDGGLDFGEEASAAAVAPKQFTPAEFTQEERDIINELVNSLGI